MPFLAWASIAALASESDQRFCINLPIQFARAVIPSIARDLSRSMTRIPRCDRDDKLLSRLQFRDRLGHHRLLVPGEEDPGILAHFGDVAVDRGPTGGLRIDSGKMGLG